MKREPKADLYISKCCGKPEINCPVCKLEFDEFVCKSKREGICIYRKIRKKEGNMIMNI